MARDYVAPNLEAPRLDRLFPNMAEFDRSTADEYNFEKQLFGSMAKANKDQADRGTIRTIMGENTLREVMLK